MTRAYRIIAYDAHSSFTTTFASKSLKAKCCLLQLDGIKVEGEGGSMNVSAVALAAVDIAASVVDAALLNVQRTVAKSMQQPEVCTRPGLVHIWCLLLICGVCMAVQRDNRCPAPLVLTSHHHSTCQASAAVAWVLLMQVG